MSTPHWSYRLSQNPKSKAKSAGIRDSLIQSSFEILLRDKKTGAATRYKSIKRNDVLPRPFTSGGHQTKKPAESRATKSAIKAETKEDVCVTKEDVYVTKKDKDTPADSKNVVRFQVPTRPDKSSSEKQSVLTEIILQRHNEYLRKNGHISMMDRVSAWVRSVPLFLDDPDTVTISDSALVKGANNFSNLNSTSPIRHQSAIFTSTPDNSHERDRLNSQIRQKSLPLLTADNTVSPVFMNSWSSNEKMNLTRRIKELQKNAPIDGRKSIDTQKGKLLCCLKVEIKIGVYKMLPIHQNDDPAELSAEFCKTFRLIGSMESLKMHIQSSIKTYGK